MFVVDRVARPRVDAGAILPAVAFPGLVTDLARTCGRVESPDLLAGADVERADIAGCAGHPFGDEVPAVDEVFEDGRSGGDAVGRAAYIALDADPTGGLSRWAARTYEGPTFTCHHEADEARLAHLIHRVAQEADVVVVDTAGFGNRAATVAMTAADAVLIPMVPGEGDLTEAARTVELVAGVASAARREIPSRVVMNRVRSSTALSRHAAAEAGPLPKLEAGLSDLVAYGEMGFSGRMPAGKAGAEAAALIAELRAIGFLPELIDNTASVKTKHVKTARAGR